MDPIIAALIGLASALLGILLKGLFDRRLTRAQTKQAENEAREAGMADPRDRIVETMKSVADSLGELVEQYRQELGDLRTESQAKLSAQAVDFQTKLAAQAANFQLKLDAQDALLVRADQRISELEAKLKETTTKLDEATVALAAEKDDCDAMRRRLAELEQTVERRTVEPGTP